MFAVYDTTNVTRRNLRASFATFGEACDYVEALHPVCFEIDADHPGCADAYLPGGLLYIVEPEVAA